MNDLKLNNSSEINVKLYFFIKIKVSIEMLESYEISRINIYDKLACLNKQIYKDFAIPNYDLVLYHN